jgi:hypothetical protein
MHGRRRITRLGASAALLAGTLLASTAPFSPRVTQIRAATNGCASPGAAIGVNLVGNGNAEAGTPSRNGNEVVPIPCWTTTGTETVAAYAASQGNFPAVTDPGPADRGTSFFAGGPNSRTDVSTATQSIALSPVATRVEAGVGYTLSGYLGGFASQQDNTVIAATFLDAGQTVVGEAKIGPVTADDRGAKTALLLRTASGTVPQSARSIRLTMTMTRKAGAYNDGYADDVSLILGAVSNPSQQTCPPAASTGGTGRTYPSATLYGLELGNTFAGFLNTFTGGNPYGVITSVAEGSSSFKRKLVHGVRYEPIVLTFSSNMDTSLYTWIGDALSGRARSMSGQILTTTGSAITQGNIALEFHGATISSVVFPAVDHAGKDAAFITLTLAPESTTVSPGGCVTISGGPAPRSRTKWLETDFKLSIDGLETDGVTQIEPISVTVPLRTESGAGDVSNLAFRVAVFRADSIHQWFDDFIVAGHHAQKDERKGTLEYQGQDGTTLFTLDLEHLGIFRYDPLTLPSPEEIKRVQVEMYCDQLAFS